MKKMKEIVTSNQLAEDWIQKWRDAINLLTWKTPTENLEKELLMQELGRQWISWDRAKSIMQNLEDFNKDWDKWWYWYTFDNNFISNTFEELGDFIEYEYDKFDKNVISEFRDNGNSETTTISSLLSKSEKVQVNTNISESISKIYNNEIPYIQMQNTNSYLSRADLINIHSNLNKWIIILKDLIEFSEKVCNKQSTWEWLCTTN